MSYITFDCIIGIGLVGMLLNGYTNLHISSSICVIVLANLLTFLQLLRCRLNVGVPLLRTAFRKELLLTRSKSKKILRCPRQMLMMVDFPTMWMSPYLSKD